MLKLNFKKFHLHLHRNGKLFGFGVSPNFDWKILFTVFLILILSVSVLGFYMFIAIANGDIFVVSKAPVVETKKLDVNLLQNTLKFYDSRAIKLEEIKANKNQVSDPSL